MAVNIKAIKCPQCGSNQHIKISTDHYKCNNCGTEYILDNDDININVNHRNQSIQPKSNIGKIIGIGIALLFVLILFVKTCGKSTPSSNRNNYVTTTSTPVKNEKNPDRFEERDFRCSHIFENDKKSIIYFSIVKRRYAESYSDPRNGYYLVFRNLLSQKILYDRKLDINEIKDSRIRVFSNGIVYICLNKKQLYQINKKDLTLDDVTEREFSKHPEFSSGIANLAFVADFYGDGFKVITNMGKEYMYYPIVEKVYTQDAFYDAALGFSSLLPGAKDVTYYVFTRRSSDFEDVPIQLLRIVYKYNNGGPEEKELHPSWHKNFGRSGIFTERSPYTKRLVLKDRRRIVSYKDLTPERIYFNGGVKYYDDSVVIIKYRPTVADDAPIILQCLSLPSMDIKWSLDIDKKGSHMKSVIKTSQGYIAQLDSENVLLIGENGNLKKEITISTEHE